MSEEHQHGHRVAEQPDAFTGGDAEAWDDTCDICEWAENVPVADYTEVMAYRVTWLDRLFGWIGRR